jgi:polysaccharide export outer membrane protein
MRESCRWLIYLGLVMVLMTSTGRTQEKGSTLAPATSHGLVNSELRDVREYRLHVSDSMEVKLPYSPEFDQTVIVQPDGKVRLREIPAITAAGMTPSELEQRISKAYGDILNKPSVSIILRDFQKPSYFASGEVGKPGRYDLRDDVTLLQAISEAGGMLNERAKKQQVVLFRSQHNGTYEAKSYNVASLLKPKGMPETILIMPGDVIYVPQNFMSKIQKYLPTSSMGTYLSPTAF